MCNNCIWFWLTGIFGLCSLGMQGLKWGNGRGKCRQKSMLRSQFSMDKKRALGDNFAENFISIINYNASLDLIRMRDFETQRCKALGNCSFWNCSKACSLTRTEILLIANVRLFSLWKMKRFFVAASACTWSFKLWITLVLLVKSLRPSFISSFLFFIFPGLHFDQLQGRKTEILWAKQGALVGKRRMWEFCQTDISYHSLRLYEEQRLFQRFTCFPRPSLTQHCKSF